MSTGRTHPSSLTFVDASQPKETEDHRHARDHYLAANPEAAELQRAQITEICADVGLWLDWYDQSKQMLVNGGEFARLIGGKIIAFADTYPGKKLTKDFWRNVQEKFTTPGGRKISLDMLEWYMHVARQNPKPITDIKQIPPLKEFLLIGEDEYEATLGRGPQTPHVPANPYNDLSASWRIEEWKSNWELFKKHQQYGNPADLKARRPDLHHEMVQKLRAVHEFSDQALHELGEI